MSAGPYSIGGQPWPGLSKLIEECGEVQQIAGKIIGVGGEHFHYDGTNLADRLEEELGDMLAAVEFVIQKNALARKMIEERTKRKLEVFRRWDEGVRRGEAG